MVGVDYQLEKKQANLRNKRIVSRVGTSRRGARLNMTGWDPQVITASEMDLAKPVIHLARLLYAQHKRRIFRDGRTIKGSPYGKYSDKPIKSKDPNREFGYLWISPDKPQPRGYKFKVKHGRFKGWATYGTSAEYYAARGKSGINFVNTGRLAKGMQIRPMSPLNVRVGFYGGRRKSGARLLGATDDNTSQRRVSQAKNNSDLGRILSSRYGSLLETTRAERAEYRRLFMTIITPELLDVLRLADSAVAQRKKLRARDNAIAKARRLFDEANRGT